ncbi:UDP-N-acetylmuramoyl-tripeptide--D-alanyl-D-alanine ligase [Shewanella waksmanii]|uniref:UDP-N-acetylmuramoyl-tripeptide--D-alanyl-D- alanine ligase n=1 Tax=Shewanella waksmanii TaxID=213783 RepID=UPI00373535EF
MIPMTLSELTARLGAQLIGEDTTIDSLSSDSRVMEHRTLFVALIGERFDGHDFANVAVENGAVALLVSKALPVDVPQLLVTDTQKAMGEIGSVVKARVAPISVALTGSNGKTSVKEMVATILSQQHKVLYTAGNFNNEIGVPLTLLRLQPQHEFGVFELGANHIGEIDYTSSLVRPNVALVNNVASAHLEGFGSLDGVAQAKSEIFNHLQPDGTAIINADDDYAEFMRQAAANYKQLSYSIVGSADLVAKQLQHDSQGRYQFQLIYLGQSYPVVLPLSGKHQVHNALAASAICLALGISVEQIVSGLSSLQPVKGRMTPKVLGRLTIIDDSYNANPASVGAAIDWLQEIEANRCLVLGDLGELGDNAALLHGQLGEMAKAKGIDMLFCLGELSRHSAEAFGGVHHSDFNQLIAELVEYINGLSGKVTILVKGSRSAKMERVVEALVNAFERRELL